MARKIYPKEIQEKVIELYKSGMQIKDICKETGVWKDYPTKIAKKLGIARGSGSFKANKMNPDLFRVGTPNSDYWLGYIVADGCIMKIPWSNTHSIQISTQDEEIVEKYMKYCGKDINLHRGKYIKQLHFCNREIGEYIVSIGITPRKSLTIKLKCELSSHMLRGIFDGDGCVHNKRTHCKITTGSPALGEQIVEFLKQNGIYSKLRKRTHEKNSYDVWIERKKDFILFFLLIYKDAEYLMQRKYDKFLNTMKLKNIDILNLDTCIL